MTNLCNTCKFHEKWFILVFDKPDNIKPMHLIGIKVIDFPRILPQLLVKLARNEIVTTKKQTNKQTNNK